MADVGRAAPTFPPAFCARGALSSLALLPEIELPPTLAPALVVRRKQQRALLDHQLAVLPTRVACQSAGSPSRSSTGRSITCAPSSPLLSGRQTIHGRRAEPSEA